MEKESGARGPPESPTAGVPERLPVRSFLAEAGSGGRECRVGEARVLGFVSPYSVGKKFEQRLELLHKLKLLHPKGQNWRAPAAR